jgi:2-oxoacid:acceptor oxidoreductase delta subunit (pyruvate/2-ketoisovalerate family)
LTEALPSAPHLLNPSRPITTGSWRTFRPVLDHEKCNLCLLCWVYCPDGAMKRSEEAVMVDLEFCKGCGICAKECRKDAIDMVEEG